MSRDAIVLLKEDHKEMRRVFREFERTEDANKQGQLVAKMIELLTVHTFVENEAMYPEVRQLLPELETDVLESYEEHHVADLLVAELARMRPDAERFEAKTTVLIESVEHHMKEEEEEWFPKVRKGLSRTQLQQIGDRILELKEKAPRSPEDPAAKKSAQHAVTA